VAGSLGQLRGPRGVPGVDRLRVPRVGEAGGLPAENHALRLDLQTGVERIAIEEFETQHVQRRNEGCVRIIGERIAQGQRAVCGELGDKPVRDRPHVVVFFDWVGRRNAHYSGGVVVRIGSGVGAWLVGLAIDGAVLGPWNRRLVSITIVGISFWLVAGWLGSPIALIWALVFGALISPTDPVAVLSILKAVHVPEELEVEMTGEALLNDGVGVVVFTILVAAAVGTEGVGFGVVQVGQLFFVEALGGAILGLITGYVAYHAMRLIDDYRIEVLISLAVVMGTYALASKLDLSGFLRSRLSSLRPMRWLSFRSSSRA